MHLNMLRAEHWRIKNEFDASANLHAVHVMILFILAFSENVLVNGQLRNELISQAISTYNQRDKRNLQHRQALVKGWLLGSRPSCRFIYNNFFFFVITAQHNYLPSVLQQQS